MCSFEWRSLRTEPVWAGSESQGGNRDDGERVPERSQSSDNLEDAKSQSRLSHVLC